MKTDVPYLTDTVLPLFDSLSMPAFIIGRDLGIVACGRCALTSFLSTPQDLIGIDVKNLMLYVPSNLAAFAAMPSSVMNPGQQESSNLHFESICKRKNSEAFLASVSVVRLADSDLTLVVIRDISGERKIQQRALQRSKELSVFNTFAGILTKRTDIEAIKRETIDMLLPLMDADTGWIYLVDQASDILNLTTHRGFTHTFLQDISRLRPGECFAGKVFVSGRPLLVKKATEDPRVLYHDGSTMSMAGAPIISGGRTLGVLGLGSASPSHFTSLDNQLLTTVAAELGVAIENARLIGELSEKMKQIELINELSGIVNSSLSIGTIFRMMVSEIRKLIHYDRASLLLYSEKDKHLLIFALDTEMDTVLRRGVKAPLGTTSAGWVIQNNRPWINRDLAEEIHFPLDAKLLNEGIRSTISIPLYQDRVLGVFNLDCKDPGQYSEKELGLLLPVAKHISIALENASLFEEISREKKEWEKTFNAITDMVWIEDGRQQVIRANNTLKSRAGLSTLGIEGNSCDNLLDRMDIINPGHLCSDIHATKQPSFHELMGNSGTIYNLWSYPLNTDEGQLYAIVHHLKDVTAEKRLEQQLIRTDKLASLGTLVAGIAHEINNPLGIIAGFSEALLERADSSSLLQHKDFEDFPEYLRTIHNEIFRCKRILGSLLDFARPPAGVFREIDINELIKEVILLINHKAAKLNHRIELNLNRDLPKLFAEPGSLRQLFMNIIINSIYFTPGKGTICIRSKLDTEARGKQFAPDVPWIRVAIADTGQGIPRQQLDKVFDPFFTTKPVGEGTGLGLAICHRIVEEHNGTIDVESEVGIGTTFVIRLPARSSHDKNPGS